MRCDGFCTWRKKGCRLKQNVAVRDVCDGQQQKLVLQVCRADHASGKEFRLSVRFPYCTFPEEPSKRMCQVQRNLRLKGVRQEGCLSLSWVASWCSGHGEFRPFQVFVAD